MKLTLPVLFLVAFAFAANGQTATQHPSKAEAEKSAGQGITFRIPKDVMPVDWKDFKGMLMLVPKRPGVIFVSYPNENETLPSLKERAVIALAKMFVHDKTPAIELPWKRTKIASHEGAKADSAEQLLYEDSEQTMQVSLYERSWNSLNLIYGYVARQSKTSKNKNDSVPLLDDQGKGSKKFDEFWKTFPSK